MMEEHLGEEFKDEMMKPEVIEKKSAAGQNTNVADLAFEAELEDTENSGMVTRIKSWLFLSVFNILAYVFFSQPSIMEGTSICEYVDGKTYYYRWVPEQVSAYLAAYNMFICRHEFLVQAYMAVFMMSVVMYLTISRLPGIWQPMSLVTFNVLFLGIGCGLPGKVYVDAMGGNGKLLLFVWATFCVLQFLIDVITLALCVVRGTKSSGLSGTA